MEWQSFSTPFYMHEKSLRAVQQVSGIFSFCICTRRLSKRVSESRRRMGLLTTIVQHKFYERDKSDNGMINFHFPFMKSGDESKYMLLFVLNFLEIKFLFIQSLTYCYFDDATSFPAILLRLSFWIHRIKLRRQWKYPRGWDLYEKSKQNITSFPTSNYYYF